MSRIKTAQHYSRLLRLWPADVLRPERTFAAQVLIPRLQNAPSPARNEEAEINAAYLLLENSISKQYPLQEKLLRPASNPDFYTDLKRKLAEAPNETWWSSKMKWLKNMVRFN
ncbi:uncharacterized protein RCC_01105 [Ramularia collo-cygni]|uniref:Uncharacterized protein n=1 Tax=Ramularia collo-cygni TaxID=112498 RepID=A0A2D3UTP9_9PEZI|nr:uncharacterized protein RCC_01105 [Ramularia collo-cygni]CZT15237.1 uncharacterized protein RCC_01105 [Ramularia collo-cygni]